MIMRSGYRRRLLIAGLVVFLAMAAAGCSKPLPVISQGPVTVESREVSSQTDALVVNMKIPVVDGVKDEEIQARINAELENAALKDKEEITRLSQVAEKLAGNPYELQWHYTVTYNKNGILSLVTTAYQYTGGAHGMTVQKSYNYDLNAREKMNLAGLFQPGVDYKNIINKEIEKQIASHPENYFEGESGFQSIADNQEYYLKDGNLVIYFGLYEIAPYVSGIPEFTIPFARFDGGVRAELLK
jgi:hypothetical protein